MATFTIRNEAGQRAAMAFIERLDLSKPWSVTISRPKRSTAQNALYHKWCSEIAAESGFTSDEVHEWLKSEFLPPRFVEIAGTEHPVRRSTTALKVDEMRAYMDQVYHWSGSFLGLALTLPEEMHL